MLSTEKIAKAFAAIVEEAEKVDREALPEETGTRLKTIISIAKHQSDIRGAPAGSCTADKDKS